jgi:hypothetical protein
VSSRNAYKDKGKGTMNSKIQRQACKWLWWLNVRSASCGSAKIDEA